MSNDKSYTFGVMIENPDFLEGQTALYNLKYLAAINKRITEEEILKALKEVGLYDQRHEQVKKVFAWDEATVRLVPSYYGKTGCFIT
ncbi:hypothetical protein HXZ66_19735 [Bacillus sp. A116_S68]|nr:hypothetical protein HXZ66_19735 [Bacillus sp. A116_S68]